MQSSYRAAVSYTFEAIPPFLRAVMESFFASHAARYSPRSLPKKKIKPSTVRFSTRYARNVGAEY
jgi:hypothetical protein